MWQVRLFQLSEQLKRLSDCGDLFETMNRSVDFEAFRSKMEEALAHDGVSGGWLAYDLVEMLKELILAAQNSEQRAH